MKILKPQCRRPFAFKSFNGKFFGVFQNFRKKVALCQKKKQNGRRDHLCLKRFLKRSFCEISNFSKKLHNAEIEPHIDSNPNEFIK